MPISIYISPEEERALAFLDGKVTNNKTEASEKKAAGNALVFYKKIMGHKLDLIKLKSELKPIGDKEARRKKETEIDAKNRELYEEFINLSAELKNISNVPDELVRSHVNMSAVDLPDSVVAKPLTEIPGDIHGSDPTESATIPIGWPHADKLNKEKGPRKGDYVKGHLLNEKMHGPGIRGNLMPLTRSANGSMQVIETKVNGLLQPGKILWYDVKVKYHLL